MAVKRDPTHAQRAGDHLQTQNGRLFHSAMIVLHMNGILMTQD